MSDLPGGGTESGSEGASPPRGFAGPGPVPNPYQVPVPPIRSSPSAPKRRALPLVLVLVVVAALVGGGIWFATSSGDDSSGGDVSSDGPGAAIVAWASAMAAHDYETACKAMATTAVEKLTATGATCPAELERLSPNGLYDKADNTAVLDEQIDGDRARVTVKIGGSPLAKQPMAATREDGTWKADPFSFGADVGTSKVTTPTTPPAGSADSPGDAFLKWATAMGNGDWTGACALTSANSIAYFKETQSGCEAAYASEPGHRDWVDGEQTKIDAERPVSKDVARVQATRYLNGQEMSSINYRMVREGGVWKFDPQRSG